MNIDLDYQFFYKINLKDNYKSLTQKFNAEKSNILRNNDKLNLYAGEWVKLKQNDYIMHYVKPAETLNKIAEKYNMDKNKILLDNNLLSERLFIGQMLKIYK